MRSREVAEKAAVQAKRLHNDKTPNWAVNISASLPVLLLPDASGAQNPVYWGYKRAHTDDSRTPAKIMKTRLCYIWHSIEELATVDDLLGG